MWGNKANGDDFETEADRHKFALDLREGLSPEGVIDDWGDFDCDTRKLPQTELHASSRDEIEEYYDELRDSGVQIL